MDLGRFYSAEDLQLRARVCVLGSESKEKLFSGRFPLGEKVRINGIPYEVIGVLKPRPQEGAENSINRVIYIPFSTMSDFRNTYYIDMIWLDFLGYNYGGVEKSVRNTLAAQHNFRAEDQRALFVFSMMEQLSQFRIITMALQVMLAFIGALTLGIGGVGLMNIMLVSVTQRTREIGVEKALGARRFDIVLQFLSEALAITFLGGLLGYCAGLHHFLLCRHSHLLQCAGQARRGRRHSTHHFTRQRIGCYRNPGVGGIGRRHDSGDTRVPSRSD